MKAIIPTDRRYSKKDIAKIQQYSIQVAEERAKKETRAITERSFKLMFYVLHESHGWGTQRLSKLLDSLNAFMDEHKDDEVLWDRIDKELIDSLKIPFEREDYEEREQVFNNIKKELR